MSYRCVTTKELTYGRRDTKRTVELLNAMKREYEAFRSIYPRTSNERCQHYELSWIKCALSNQHANSTFSRSSW